MENWLNNIDFASGGFWLGVLIGLLVFQVVYLEYRVRVLQKRIKDPWQLASVQGVYAEGDISEVRVSPSSKVIYEDDAVRIRVAPLSQGNPFPPTRIAKSE